MLKQAQPVAKVSSSRKRVTYADFLRREDGNHVEWVDGEYVQMSPVTADHDDITGFLILVFGVWLRQHDAGVFKHEPFQMKTGAALPGRSPDVLVLLKKNLPRLKQTYLDGPADVVVEVVSPGSQSVDRVVKFREYEQGGVREYWLIDPTCKQCEFYLLGRGGTFKAVPLKDGVFASRVLKGLTLAEAWLWRRPFPSVFEMARVWGFSV